MLTGAEALESTFIVFSIARCFAAIVVAALRSSNERCATVIHFEKHFVNLIRFLCFIVFEIWDRYSVIEALAGHICQFIQELTEIFNGLFSPIDW